MNYKKNCRICLEAIKTVKINITGQVQSEFYFLTDEVLEESEELSRLLCFECFTNLNNSFKFKTLCLEGQEKLRNLKSSGDVNALNSVGVSIKQEIIDEEAELNIQESDFLTTTLTVKEEPLDFSDVVDVKVEPSLEDSLIQDMEVEVTEISLDQDDVNKDRSGQFSEM